MNVRKALSLFEKPFVILFFAFLVIGLVLVVGYLSFRATERAAFEEFNKRQLAIAQGTTTGIEVFFDHVAGSMRALGDLQSIRTFDEQATRNELKRVLRELEDLDVNDVGILDSKGVLRFNVAAPQIEGVDFSFRDYFKEARQMSSGDDNYVIEFIDFRGADAGEKGVLVAAPIFAPAEDNPRSASDTFGGVAVATVKLNVVTERFVAPIRHSERGHALLLDGKHTVLWSPDQALFGKDMSKVAADFPDFRRVLEQMTRAGSGVAEVSYKQFNESSSRFSDDPEDILMAYVPVQVGSQSWELGVWAPQEDARSLVGAVYLRLTSLVGVVVFVLAVSSAQMIRLGRRQARRALGENMELRSAQEALSLSEERFRTIFEQSSVGIVVGETSGKIVDTNARLQQMLGYDKRELSRMSILDICDLEEETEAHPLPEAADDDAGNVHSHERCFVRKDGSKLWANHSTTVLKDSIGRPTYVLSTIEDITEARKARELASALDEVRTQINATLDHREIMQMAVEKAAHLVECESAGILLPEDGHWVVRFSYGRLADRVGTRVPEDKIHSASQAFRTGEPFISDDAFGDEALNSELVEQQDIRSIMNIRISPAKGAPGVISFIRHDRPRPFTQAEVDFADRLAQSVALALDNAYLYEAERHIAYTLQRALLTMPDKLTGIRFGHLYHSATEAALVGGDFFDLFAVAAGKIGIVVGDVSGKGVQAATLTSLVKDTIRAHSAEGHSPASVIEKTDRAVRQVADQSTFITLFFGILETQSGILAYCSAGHPEALLRRDKSVRILEYINSPAVGVMEGLGFDEGEIRLQRGDLLLLYTDGIIEAKQNKKLFGKDGLVQAVSKHADAPPDQLPGLIYEDVFTFSSGFLFDDMAILALTLETGPAPPARPPAPERLELAEAQR